MKSEPWIVSPGRGNRGARTTRSVLMLPRTTTGRWGAVGDVIRVRPLRWLANRLLVLLDRPLRIGRIADERVNRWPIANVHPRTIPRNRAVDHRRLDRKARDARRVDLAAQPRQRELPLPRDARLHRGTKRLDNVRQLARGVHATRLVQHGLHYLHLSVTPDVVVAVVAGTRGFV